MEIDFFFSVLKVDRTTGTELLTCPTLSLLKEDTVLGIYAVFEGYRLWVLDIDGLPFI